MSDIARLKEEIHELREELQRLIEEKDTFVDSEILEMSRMLDEMLLEYEKILAKDQNRMK